MGIETSAMVQVRPIVGVIADFVNHHSEAEGNILFDMLRLLSFAALFRLHVDGGENIVG